MALVIEGLETWEEWYAYRDDIIASLNPEGALEQDVAREIAEVRWRKRRIAFYENAILNIQVVYTEFDLTMAQAYLGAAGAASDPPDLDPGYVEPHKHTRAIPARKEMEQIIRYETHLHRLWLQLQRQYDAMQARRRGEHVPTALVDFSASPSWDPPSLPAKAS